MTIQSLEEEILSLPVKSRIRLLEVGLASLSGEGTDFEREWIEESLRRDEEADKGTVSMRNLDDVLKEVFPKK